MITEKALDNLIKPLVREHEKLEYAILQKIAFRIRQISEMSYSEALATARKLYNGEDIKLFQREINNLKVIQSKQIKNLVVAVASVLYKEAESLYKFRRVSYPELRKNEPLWELIAFLTDEIDDEYEDFYKDNIFVLRKNPASQTLAKMSVADTYRSVINEAVQLRQYKVDFYKGISRTIEQLVDSGLRKVSAADKSRTYKIAPAVSTFLLEKSKDANIRIQKIMAEQFNANGVELSAHIDSAPDHEPVQGRQFSNEEFDKLQANQPFVDLSGNSYSAIRRPIGAWNCRHWTKAIIIGISKPQYTNEQLAELIKRNAKGITMPNGKHYTGYECTQVQRKYERNISEYSTKYKIARSCGNVELSQKYFAKYTATLNAYKAFNKIFNGR